MAPNIDTKNNTEIPLPKWAPTIERILPSDRYSIVAIGTQENTSILDSKGKQPPSEQVYSDRHIHQVRAPHAAIVQGRQHAKYHTHLNELLGAKAPTIYYLDDLGSGKKLDAAIPDYPEIASAVYTELTSLDGNKTPIVLGFEPTVEMQEFARKYFDAELFGTPEIDHKYGTKSGGKFLAAELEIPTTPWVLLTDSGKVDVALSAYKELLGNGLSTVILKFDDSIGGGHKVVDINNANSLTEIQQFLNARPGVPVVMEKYIPNAASIGTNIAVHEGKFSILFATEQVVIDNAYAGGKHITQEQYNQVLPYLTKVGEKLAADNANGFYCIDWIFDENGDINWCELNSRIGATMFPAMMITDICGKIPDGFRCGHISVPEGTDVDQVMEILHEAQVLLEIENAQSASPFGVMPYNVGLAEFGKIDIVAVASTQNKAELLFTYVKYLLKKNNIAI